MTEAPMLPRRQENPTAPGVAGIDRNWRIISSVVCQPDGSPTEDLVSRLDESTGVTLIWRRSTDAEYYMRSSRCMVAGWQTIGALNTFASTRCVTMATGWIRTVVHYYMNETGAMVTGTQVIDGRRATFAASALDQLTDRRLPTEAPDPGLLAGPPANDLPGAAHRE